MSVCQVRRNRSRDRATDRKHAEQERNEATNLSVTPGSAAASSPAAAATSLRHAGRMRLRSYPFGNAPGISAAHRRRTRICATSGGRRRFEQLPLNIASESAHVTYPDSAASITSALWQVSEWSAWSSETRRTPPNCSSTRRSRSVNPFVPTITGSSMPKRRIEAMSRKRPHR